MSSYTFNAGDYAARTGHLEPLEDLAYRRMLDHCHLREVLPEDAAEVARLIRMRANVAEVQTVLAEFFTRQVDGWTHPEARPQKAGKPVEFATAGDLEAAGFTHQAAVEFIAYKQARKAPLTLLAWKAHCRESAKAGMTAHEAARCAMDGRWDGFKAAYVAKRLPAIAKPRPPAWMAASQAYGDALCGARKAGVIDVTATRVD